MKRKVLVIIPAYQEEKNIENVIENIKNNYPQYEYIIVNDGSKDGTSLICKRNKYNFLDLPINLGIGGAVQTGYKYALEKGYDIAVQIDGDGQHDISFLEEMINVMDQHNADIIIGSRFLEKKGFQSSVSRRIGIHFLSHLIFLCTGHRVYDVTSGYRVVNKKYIKYYADNYSVDYPEPEAIVMALEDGAKIIEVPVIMQERIEGKSSIHAWKSLYYMIKVSLAIIVCRISLGIRR